MKKILILIIALLSILIVTAKNQSWSLKGKSWQTQLGSNAYADKNPFLITFNDDSTCNFVLFQMNGDAIYTKAIYRSGVYKETETKLSLKLFITEKNVVSESEYTLQWISEDEVIISTQNSKETKLIRFNTSGDFFTRNFTPMYVESLISRGKIVSPSILEVLAPPFRNVRGKAYMLKDSIPAPYLAFKFDFDGSECMVLIDKIKLGKRAEKRDFFGGSNEITFVKKLSFNNYNTADDKYEIEWINSQEFYLVKDKMKYKYVLSELAKEYFEINGRYVNQ